MQITYQATSYKPELVTGVYVRCIGRFGSYSFKFFETATCFQKGPHFNKLGMGYTLREYVTNGDELPEEFKQRCISSKTNEKLSLTNGGIK